MFFCSVILPAFKNINAVFSPTIIVHTFHSARFVELLTIIIKQTDIGSVSICPFCLSHRQLVNTAFSGTLYFCLNQFTGFQKLCVNRSLLAFAAIMLIRPSTGRFLSVAGPGFFVFFPCRETLHKQTKERSPIISERVLY